MKPVKRIRSRSVVLPTRDIDTDQIIAARFLTTTSREGLGKNLFHDLRYRSDGSDNTDFRAEPTGRAGLPDSGGRQQFRLWLIARARALGLA